jgi:hypothetical protein
LNYTGSFEWSGTRRKRGEAGGRATATAAGEPTRCTPQAGREGIIPPAGTGWIIGRARSAPVASGIAPEITGRGSPRRGRRPRRSRTRVPGRLVVRDAARGGDDGQGGAAAGTIVPRRSSIFTWTRCPATLARPADVPARFHLAAQAHSGLSSSATTAARRDDHSISV